ncbi:MAG: hypothetical protein IKU52_03570 [Clostridia bacterium]|nr:hypothetical protein [Clostridia bacterium]
MTGSLLVGIIGVFILIVAIATLKSEAIDPHKEAQAAKRKRNAEDEGLAYKQKSLAEVRGLEKFSRMHTEEVANYKQGVEAIRTLGVMMENSVVQEKEKDWAIWGGIADGLAGPIAGVGVALETMKENEAIRARNEANKAWGVAQRQQLFEMASKAENNRPTHMSMMQINSLYAAIFSWSPMTLFSKLMFKNVIAEQNRETGTVTVSAEWSTLKNTVVIDGSIRAKLYNSNFKCVGCAYLNLPKTGTLDKTGKLSGVCVGLPLADNYSVQLEPVDLWELTAKQYEDYPGDDNISLQEHVRIVEDLKSKYSSELNK